MAAQEAGDFCEEIEKLYDLLEVHRSRPSPPGRDWARDHWFQLQSVVDRIAVLQKEAKVKRGKGKAIVCAVRSVPSSCGGGQAAGTLSGAGCGCRAASGGNAAARTITGNQAGAVGGEAPRSDIERGSKKPAPEGGRHPHRN